MKEAEDIHAITFVDGDEYEVYLRAEDLLRWLRSDMHAEQNQPLLHAIAEIVDFSALAALSEQVDSDQEY